MVKEERERGDCKFEEERHEASTVLRRGGGMGSMIIYGSTGRDAIDKIERARWSLDLGFKAVRLSAQASAKKLNQAMIAATGSTARVHRRRTNQ